MLSVASEAKIRGSREADSKKNHDYKDIFRSKCISIRTIFVNEVKYILQSMKVTETKSLSRWNPNEPNILIYEKQNKHKVCRR